uniref:Uncharacterized protein n=1 Tax=Quercus lobata TaxID=97700 RepID=A0A7N2MW80_QUELO
MLAQPMKLSDNVEIEFCGIEGPIQNLSAPMRPRCQQPSLKWVLKLRDGRRVVVPIQISLPPGEVTEVLGEQNQLASVPLRYLDSLEVSSAQFEGDEVLVEDWVSDPYSEAAELLNEGGLSPLAVEPLTFSLPLAMEGQEVVGVENPVRKDSYSEWFQSRFNGFDNFLGMSLQGLGKSSDKFLVSC